MRNHITVLLAGLLAAGCGQTGNSTTRETTMNDTIKGSPVKSEEFKWGAACTDSLSIGLQLKSVKTGLNESIEWTCAVKNLSGKEQRVIVSDGSFPRFKLLIFPAGENKPAAEFYMDEKKSAGNRMASPKPWVVLLKEGETATLSTSRTYNGTSEGVSEGHGLRKGNYIAKVQFGGEGFEFTCESGAVNLVIE